MEKRHVSKRNIFYILTIISFLLTIIFFVFPSNSIGSGDTNIGKVSKTRLAHIYNLTNNNVKSFSITNEEESEIRGLSLIIQLCNRNVFLNHCDLPSNARMVYSISNEDGDTIISDSISLCDLVLPMEPSEYVEIPIRFSSAAIKKGDKLNFFFALKDVPKTIDVNFYGYYYADSDERDSLVLGNDNLADKAVLFYRVLVDSKDYSLALLFLLITSILAEGFILCRGTK